MLFSRNKLALALSITLSLTAAVTEQVQAKGRRGGGGGGGGGVFLNTPNPTNPLEHNNRGVELGSKGLWSDAIREHELAVQGDPYRVDFRTNLSAAHLEYGNYLRARGRTYDAMVQYRQAMIVDPANAKADQELDICMKKLGKDPYDFATRKRLAEDADVSQQYDTAIVEWRKCVKMRDTGLMHFELGKVLLKAGKDVDGYRELRKAVAMEWATDEKLELAACHRQLGDLLKEYAYKAKEDPNKPRGTTGMKRLYNAFIEYRRAVLLNPADATAVRGMLECAREGVAIKPNSFDNHLCLGASYLLSGDFQHARQEFETCFKIAPTRPEVDQARIAYHQSVARSPLADDALVAASVDKIRAAIDQSPTENARLYYILGRLRERQADPEKAKKCYDKAWSINPHIDPDLAQAFGRLGAPKEALATKPKTQEELAKEMEEKKKAMAELEKQKGYSELDNLVESGKFDEVITKGTEQYKSNPKDATIVLKIGVAHERKAATMADGEEKDKEINEAKAWYRLGAGLQDKTGASAQAEQFLAQLDSSRAQPKIKEADELLAKGDLVSAASAYRDALILAPRRSDVHRKLGEVLDKMGDKEGARKEREEAERLDRSPAPKKEASEGSKPL